MKDIDGFDYIKFFSSIQKVYKVKEKFRSEKDERGSTNYFVGKEGITILSLRSINYSFCPWRFGTRRRLIFTVYSVVLLKVI